MVSSMYEEAKVEPTLSEIFSDPIIKMLMERDGALRADIEPVIQYLQSIPEAA